MRCKNCGWENEPGNLKCEKCNAPLNGSMVESNYASQDNSAEDEELSLKGTVSEKKAFRSSNNVDEVNHEHPHSNNSGRNTCPKCGYQISPSMMVCPACGAHLSQRTDSPEEKRPSAKKCPSCGNDIIPGTKFCAYCGKPFRMGTVNAGPAATPGSYFTLGKVWKSPEEI